MYSKQEASALRQAFWTSFGQYMMLHLSADGEKVNWVNYKTGEKHIYFRMQADNKTASISIELTHPSQGVQELYFEQFQQFEKILHATLGEDWIWEQDVTDEYGKAISRIHTSIHEVNIFNKNDWPTIISFLKPRIMALDEFWSSAKYTFEMLR